MLMKSVLLITSMNYHRLVRSEMSGSKKKRKREQTETPKMDAFFIESKPDKTLNKALAKII